MSQSVFDQIIPTATSGSQLATILNDFKDAVISGFSGPSRPTEIDPGGYWIDTSAAPTWRFKIWTGSIDITVFELNLTTGTPSITGSNNQFEIARITADALGPQLRLLKERIANNGQVLTNDIVGDLVFVGSADDNTNPTMARVRVVSLDDVTNSENGAYMSFEAVPINQTALVEMMRLINGRLGVGTTSPDDVIHAVGDIRAERQVDAVTPSVLKAKKRRVSGGGQVLNADEVGAFRAVSTDDLGQDATVAEITSVALENHTSTARGTRLSVKTTATGAASATEVMSIGNAGVSITPPTTLGTANITTLNPTTAVGGTYEGSVLRQYVLDQQNIASANTINNLSSTRAVARITGSTAGTIGGIVSSTGSKVVLVHNASTVAQTIGHQVSGAAPADRFDLPEAQDIELGVGASIEFFYDTVDSRWKLKSGSGSGGGGQLKVFAAQNIAGNGEINSDVVNVRQLRQIQSTGGTVQLSNTPFGVTGGWKNGTEFILVGLSDTDSLILNYNDAAKGVIGNFSQIEFVRGKVVTLVYIQSLDRFILAGGN
jgi:hypothetical protein